MAMSPKEYDLLSKKASPNSPWLKNLIWAFVVGGLICTLGQALTNLYLFLDISKEMATAMTSVSLIFLSALLTGLNMYDDIAKHAGAGTLVPITGFANAVVSPALEFKAEGFILGLAAKMFVIAGPVLVYGISASIFYGILVFLFGWY